MTTFDTLAGDYDAGRSGYANELYDTLVNFGLKRSDSVLDVGCGTGLASAPLAVNGFTVTGVDVSEPMLEIARRRLPNATFVNARAEKLPFKDNEFGVAMSAQVFHHLDRTAALKEMQRVVKPGGMIAIWWKRLLSDDPVKMLRDDVMRTLGAEPPSSGLSGGFREFYSASLSDHTLRVIPWRMTTTLGQFLKYERSRKNVRDVLGAKAESYFEALEKRLTEHYGDANAPMTLGYMHYVYLGKNP